MMEGDLCAGSVGVQPTLVIAVTIRGGPSMKFSMAVALMSHRGIYSSILRAQMCGQSFLCKKRLGRVSYK